tara:strand:- start:4130 stop:4822 length:693 start_codon:yes stop_codon:yes gene_type:complete
MARLVSDALTIMRLAISRRNANDPDSSDATLTGYLNDFVSLTMGNEVRLFEQYGTLVFDIDETVTDGVYTFNDVGASSNFETISGDGFISLKDPPTGSLSWTPLKIYLNPGEFYGYWGVENTDVLTLGQPTSMLYYGNQFVFRTIPNTDYTVTLYGYKKHEDFATEGSPALEFDYWLRFLAYGAAVNYAMDYRFSDQILASLKRDYSREKRLMLTKTHNQIKTMRGLPSF